MRRSAGQPRRPRPAIQWQDDASAPRVGNFLSDDAPPYRALLLAAVLGVLSVVAVVSVIQYQRHSLSAVAPLLEEARADGDAAAADETRQAARSEAAAEPQPEARHAQVKSVEHPAPVVASAAATAAEDSGSRQVAAIQEDEKESRLVRHEPEPQAENTAAAAPDQAGPLPQVEPQQQADQAAQPMEEGDTGMLGYAEDPTPDHVPIPEAAERPEKVVTAAIMQPEEPETAGQQEKPEAVEEPKKAEAKGAPARVRSAVFLRARPADGSTILTTIPGGAQVAVAPNCRSWCSVSYAGKRGFIYKGFLAR